MAEELDPKQQKLGNSGGEGVDNRFWIGSLDWFSKYSNVTAGSNIQISKQCGNSSGFFDIRTKSDCMGRCRTPMRNEEGELTWLCKETTNLNVLNEECCHFACCKRMKKMAKWLMVQNLHIIIQTNLANITNSMTTKTEMVSIDIPHSTTPLNSGSAPTRRQQYLALIPTAVLIYIHGCRQANFL